MCRCEASAPESIPLRNEFSIVEGRMFKFGTNEVIAGRGAKGQFVNLNVGDTVVSGQNRWDVVGIFESDGGVAETEIWIDARTLQGAYRRGNTYQSLLARLESRDSFDRSATGSRRIRSSMSRSAARTSTTRRSRRH